MVLKRRSVAVNVGLVFGADMKCRPIFNTVQPEPTSVISPVMTEFTVGMNQTNFK